MPLSTNILIILTTFSLLLYAVRSSQYTKVLIIFFFIFLVIVQFQTTRISTIFEYSGLEKYLIDRRAQSTPLIARYLDPPQFYRFREYLFSSINFVNIFLSPLLIVGIYAFIKKPIKLIAYLLLLSLFLLALISPNGKYGSILLQPFIYFLIIYGLTLVKK